MIKPTIRRMASLVIILSLHLFMLIPWQSAAQTTPQTKSGATITAQQAIKQIEEKTGYTFFYVAGDLAGINVEATKISGDINNMLEAIFNGTGITWKISNKEIALRKNAEQAKKTPTDKPRTLTGTITDGVDGSPIVAAYVMIKGTDKYTVTDLDGNYSLEIRGKKVDLVISSLGYKEKNLYVSDQGVLNVVLEPDSEVLGEAVVVGAGTQRKVSVTGAISAIKGDLLAAPTSSLTNNLAGKLAGVISMTKSGQPGSTSEFYIRGIGTFGGRTAPLIIMDGVEITSSDLNNIPTESIESFSILKDASATAIYGARGANGVMIVTTKSGEENTRAKINVTVENSFLQPVNMVEYADGVTYMQAYNEATLARNPDATVLQYSPEKIKYTQEGIDPYLFPNVDWYNLMFKKLSLSQRANVNVSGGGSRVTYYMSLQMNHDGGILQIPKNYSFNNNYNRFLYTFQNNIGYQLTPSTKLTLRMNAQIGNTKAPNISAADIFQHVQTNNPVTFPAIYPAAEGDTHLKFGSTVMSAGRYFNNPYAMMLNSYREDNSSKMNVSLNIDQKLDFITKGLSLTALINFNNYSNTYYTRSLTPFYYDTFGWDVKDPATFQQYKLTQLQQGSEYISQSGSSRSSNSTFYFDARLNWARSFEGHNISAMAMYMMREYRSDVLPNRNQGLSGRITYDWKYRYLVEFNFGYNGTERLTRKERYDFFPAVSIGWVPSNEPFWEPISKVADYFKVRASYGFVGSDETGTSAGAPHFLYLNTVTLSGSGAGNTFHTGYTGSQSGQGAFVNTYAIENGHWERAQEFDVGFDLHLFNQLNITFDYYRNHRDRILMKRASFPYLLGYTLSQIPFSNIGKVDNSGIELSANWKKQFNKDFNIDVRFNYTYSKNKYVYVDEPDYPYVWQSQTGKPIGAMYGYIAEGLFQSYEEIENHADQSLFGSAVMPGDIKYRDVNGDGKITFEDQAMLSPYGNMPRIQYGIGVSLQWKKLDFSIYFNGSAKRNIMLSPGAMEPFCKNDSNDKNLMKWIADGHWSEGADNSNAIYPRLGTLTTQTANNRQESSFWMRKADFFRLKTIELGYTFPFVRVYLSGDNIAVWSPFKYWDPELAYNSYPLSRTFNIGLQFKF